MKTHIMTKDLTLNTADSNTFHRLFTAEHVSFDRHTYYSFSVGTAVPGPVVSLLCRPWRHRCLHRWLPLAPIHSFPLLPCCQQGHVCLVSLSLDSLQVSCSYRETDTYTSVNVWDTDDLRDNLTDILIDSVACFCSLKPICICESDL